MNTSSMSSFESGNSKMHDNAKLNYWLIVDTIRLPNAYQELSKLFNMDDSFPLYKGSDLDHMLEQSPLVVNLGSEYDGLKKWQSMPYFDSSSVVFAVNTDIKQSDLIKHLHSLLIVSISGHKMLFRYYTNSIWLEVEQHHDHISTQDIRILLGPAQTLYWIDDEEKLGQLSNRTPSVDLNRVPYQLTSPFFSQWV